MPRYASKKLKRLNCFSEQQSNKELNKKFRNLFNAISTVRTCLSNLYNSRLLDIIDDMSILMDQLLYCSYSYTELGEVYPRTSMNSPIASSGYQTDEEVGSYHIYNDISTIMPIYEEIPYQHPSPPPQPMNQCVPSHHCVNWQHINPSLTETSKETSLAEHVYAEVDFKTSDSVRKQSCEATTTTTNEIKTKEKQKKRSIVNRRHSAKKKAEKNKLYKDKDIEENKNRELKARLGNMEREKSSMMRVLKISPPKTLQILDYWKWNTEDAEDIQTIKSLKSQIDNEPPPPYSTYAQLRYQ